MTPVSNGEWIPPPQTPKQRQATQLLGEESDRRAKRLGMTRNQFLRTAAGTATAFMVLNRVHGLAQSGEAAVLPVRGAHCDDPNAGRELLDRETFVMDVQLHHVDTDVFGAGACFLDFSDLAAQLGATPSDLECPEKLGQLNFIKEIFVDSETHVGVLSGLPSGIPQGPASMAATRNLVNQLAGSERALMQAMVDPAIPRGAPTGLDSMEFQIKELGARALKCYTYNGGWRLDDENVSYPMLERAKKLGMRLVNVHKGLPLSLFPMSPQHVRTLDFPQVVRDWPSFRFCAYHAAYFPGNQHPEGKQGSSEFIELCETLDPKKERKRVYAEIGSTFPFVLLSGGPAAAAQLIGQLLKTLGPRNILWGTDCVWWGSPQFLIDLFRNLEIPPAMQQQFGYPPLTEKAKRQILGLNAARLYKVKPKRRRCTVPSDRLAALQEQLGGVRNARRSLRWYGPQRRRDVLTLLRREGRIS
jgi:predicted TIM-barrel fold metal-dependent hydrolase